MRGPARPAGEPGSVGRCVGGWQGSPPQEQRPVGELHPRAVEAQTTGCPRLQFQGGGGRSPLSWR